MELSPERVCYVQCNYCNTILAVSVPYGSMFAMVTVRCGHCTNLLSVNMGLLLQDFQVHLRALKFDLVLDRIKQPSSFLAEAAMKDNIGGSSSKWNRFGPLHCTTDYEQPMLPPIRPPEKRQRVPSAYNRFIKDEIQRIKSSNPEISHREAFSTAAKNWAHFPHIHFGLKLDGSKEENSVAGKGFPIIN